MYAKFLTEQSAQTFTDDIHNHLCANRQGYADQTTKWADVNKHVTQDLWAVPLPPETVVIPPEATLVELLPDGWHPALELDELDVIE